MDGAEQGQYFGDESLQDEGFSRSEGNQEIAEEGSLAELSGAGEASQEAGAGYGLSPDIDREMDDDDALPDNNVIGVRQRVWKNEGTVIGVVKQYLSRMLAYRDLPPSYIDICERTFVAPEGLYPGSREPGESAAEKLEHHHVIALIAGEDMGRHYAAVHLLHNAGEITVREVRREPGEVINLESLLGTGRSGWLLDLRNDRDLGQFLGRTLADFEPHLKRQESYLVAIVPPALWEKGGHGGEHIKHYLELPASEEIIRLRLELADPYIDPRPWLDIPAAEPIRQRVRNLTPDDAVQWAETIIRVQYAPLPHDLNEEKDANETIESYEQRVRIQLAIKARENWRKHLLEWHIGHPSSRERNFLVAAALLEQTAVGEIFKAATSLAVALGERVPEVQGQQGAGIIELSHQIGADLTGDEILQFLRPDYADAVLDYFWIDRQHLQDKFVTWMCGLPVDLGEVEAGVATERITGYVIKWTTRRGKLDLLVNLVEKWAPLNKVRGSTCELITAIALDAHVGGQARSLLLAWAKGERGATPDIQVLVANVCGGPLSRFYPRQMLTRLVYLAQTPHSAVAQAVADALRTLWQQPKIREQVLQQLVKWCLDVDVVRKAAGAEAFLALASLIEDDGVPSLLAYAYHSYDKPGAPYPVALDRGWQASLESSTSAISSVLNQWLDAAVAAPVLQPLVEQSLTTAARGYDPNHPDERRVVKLSSLLFGWQPANQDPEVGERIALRDRILARLYTSNRLRTAAALYKPMNNSASTYTNPPDSNA
ncbi:hypothetical protein [Microbispora sp. ATCC PTA-5024]|uniref:hypothetical protein n=1 Tax=Microbispora sp. ATCC PTA-5024 TaxID=316330 RepID=UPI0012ED5E20|nr:hypothetical protein [Microbispora sp. ATCC PTA-5024]